MKIKMNIKTKMLVFILVTTILIFATAVGYISFSSRKMAFHDATRYSNKVAGEYAVRIQEELSNDMAIIRTLAQAYSVYHSLPQEQWKAIFIEMYHEVFQNNPHFYKLWDSWEFSMIDPTWTKPHGRYVVTYYREGGNIKYSTTTRSLDGDPARYAKVKAEGEESIWEPYFDSYVEQGQTRKFMSTLSAPIRYQGKYVGIVAVDIIMEKFQQIVAEIKPFDGSYAFLVSNMGVFIGHPNQEIIGKSLKEYIPELNARFLIDEKIKNGENFSIEMLDPEYNYDAYLSFAPIYVGKSKTPWSVGLVVPVDVVTHEARVNFFISVLVGILGLFLLAIIIFLISRNISRPLKHTTDILKKLAQGDISDFKLLEIKTGDEIENMAESVNTLIDGLNKTADFAKHIGKGNLESEFSVLSEKDVLGNALLEMRKSLKHAELEEKKRKIEDEKQNWTTLGIARFGEILRQNNTSIKDLGFNIMSNLVNYLDANQGALFVLDEKDDGQQVFELVSAIAYGRQRILKKQVKIGEELVGRCAHERLTIYLTEVPENYIEVTSGMGTANPRCILIVPAMLNDMVYGVIELASFTEFEPHKIEFVEKIGESIASTISAVKISEKTSRLLHQSQQQKEELAAQEEEMRQNLEELQATQEESARREFELRGLIHALSASTYTVEYDMHGRITDINEPFANLIGMPKEQIVGMHHKDGLQIGSEKEREADSLWADLRAGMTRKVVTKIDYNGRVIWLSETYTPILDQEDVPFKVLKIAFDISDLKEQSLEMEERARTLQQEKEEILNLKNDVFNQLDSDSSLVEEKLNELKVNYEKQIADLKKQIQNVPVKEAKPAPDVVRMEKPAWREEYETGIAELDDQRKRVMGLLEGLVERLLANKSKKEIKESLKELIDYTAYHFATEEKYFKEFKFLQAKAHTSEHQEFMEALNTFQDDFSNGRLRFLDNFITTLNQWADKHFGTTDKQYVDLFKQNGL